MIKENGIVNVDMIDSRIKFLVGNEDMLRVASAIPALPTYSDEVVAFLAELSKELMALSGIREHQDVMSYAYWIRKASLLKEKENVFDIGKRMGRGVAFHIAPSNVPINFAVSMTSSLLAGNITVIRVSNKEFEEVDIICNAMNKILSKAEFENMKRYIFIIRYDHSDEITAYLSSICDVRIIWGGNRTIAEIRKHAIPPRAIEMCFADRHSVAVIDVKAYLEASKSEAEAEKIARKFYTDTYYTDQNACSSPRIVVWLNSEAEGMDEQTEEAKSRFWKALKAEVDARYDMQPIQAIDKMSVFAELAMKKGDVRLINSDGNFMVVDVDSLDGIMDYKMSGGYFFQFCASDLHDLMPLLDKQCQTVAVLGVDKQEVVDFVMKSGARGVDRVVNIGDTMGLEFTWDGFKMIENMSRVLYIY